MRVLGYRTDCVLMRIQSVGAPNACIRLPYRLYSHENTVYRGIMRVLDYTYIIDLMRIQL